MDDDALADDEKRETRRINVNKGVSNVVNPEFVIWSALPEAQRSLQSAPPENIEQAMVETWDVGVVRREKRATLGVAYRLRVAASTQPVFAETLTLNRNAVSEQSDASPALEFVPPLESASLPSDEEMLAALTAELATQIAARFAENLGDLEIRYGALGEQALKDGKLEAAVRNSAAALAVAEQKARPAAENRQFEQAIRRQLSEAVLRLSGGA